MIVLAPLLLSLAPSTSPQAAETISGVPYEKLETRAATETRMRELLQPVRATFGPWWELASFPYAGHGKDDLKTTLAPEAELLALRPGDAGPDLDRVWEGKGGSEARWRALGERIGERIDMQEGLPPELADLATGYLWTTIESTAPQQLEVWCGSDDGLRLWVNGKLLVDEDVPRSLNPEEDHLWLPLVEGTNQLVAKVAEGYGSWDFQMSGHRELSPEEDALLQWYLDRDFPPSRERAAYRVTTIPVPRDVVLEVGGIDYQPDGRPLVATRHGDVWRVTNVAAEPPRGVRFDRFATGLHEPLGLRVRVEDEGTMAVYTVQRSELTRLVDEDGDGTADLYECYSNGWGVSGNYHEFAFGPEFDQEGNAWVTLNVGFCGALGKSIVPWRGWCLKITPDRQVVPICGGMRSPNGIGEWTDGTMFYVDNQGDYVGTNKLAELKPGAWQGHPSSLRWNPAWKDAPPERQRASVWFPYRKMGQSTADVELDATGGAFGPFDGQIFVGDQTLCEVMRVSLEVVDGFHQGACYPFLSGLDCGVNRLRFGPDGSLLVGETDRGWGSVGRKPYGLQRVVWTGETPFELREMRARSDGFELEFTQPVDVASATAPSSYRLSSYTYEYHAEYGSPEVDTKELAVASATLVDERTVRLVVPGLRAGYVHELSAAGVRQRDSGEPLVHDAAYYTLQEIPAPPAASASEAAQPAPHSSPAPAVPHAQEHLPRVLFLTHSAGYEHGVVKRPDEGTLSLAEQALTDAAKGRFEVHATKDCDEVSAAGLAGYDAVVFYTTGELPMGAEARRALVDWVAKGGAFVGIHPATDTFHQWKPYLDMIGGEFASHPWHQEVGVRVEDTRFPAAQGLEPTFRVNDEIYQFLNWQGEPPLRVVLSLDPDSVDISKSGRPDHRHALAWWRDWGEGRVFYCALGHEPDLWRSPWYLRLVLGGIGWALDGPDEPAPLPAGAVPLLVEAKDLAGWKTADGGAAGWKAVDGGSGSTAFEVVPGSGDVESAAALGSGWYHVEFQLPLEPDHTGQARANSGVYLQGRYEVQVLDSYGLEPGLGDAGAIYGVHAPDHNAARKPGRWQSYDVLLDAARYENGAKVAPAKLTVWWNGMLVQVGVEVPGPTGGGRAEDASGVGPLLLQDHGSPVRYRNVWFVPRR